MISYAVEDQTDGHYITVSFLSLDHTDGHYMWVTYILFIYFVKIMNLEFHQDEKQKELSKSFVECHLL